MADIIKHKRSATASAVPAAGQLELGELAINTADGGVYLKKSDGAVFLLGSDKADGDDPRLSDAREWTAPTVTQAEAEGGSSTARRAWTALATKQAIVAWFFGNTTALARNLLDETTESGMQSTLGLVKQSSVTDRTAGALTINGAHGMGTDSQVTSTGDLNQIRYGSVTAPVNQPNQPGIEGILWAGGRSAGARASQLFIDHSGSLYSRGYNSGRGVGFEWSEWKRSWGSLDPNAITVDTGSFGYGAGSGGTVTQATSKSTAVTLNKPSGRVTTAADALAAGASVNFFVSNTRIAGTDTVIANTVSQAGIANYRVEVIGVGAGFATIRVTNVSAGSLSEAISINFTVIKGATA
jgi:hypothetical protein